MNRRQRFRRMAVASRVFLFVCLPHVRADVDYRSDCRDEKKKKVGSHSITCKICLGLDLRVSEELQPYMACMEKGDERDLAKTYAIRAPSCNRTSDKYMRLPYACFVKLQRRWHLVGQLAEMNRRHRDPRGINLG
jgi:hypothetical protein